jgi:hypothetical protein
MQPVSFGLSGDEDPALFQISSFGIGLRDNLHVLSNNTMQRLAPLSSSSPDDAGLKSARCFQHNFMNLLLQPKQYAALDFFLRYQFYKSTPIKFQADSWNPCIVYAVPRARVDGGHCYAAAAISTLNL